MSKDYPLKFKSGSVWIICAAFAIDMAILIYYSIKRWRRHHQAVAYNNDIENLNINNRIRMIDDQER